jgi:hypothetical protein
MRESIYQLELIKRIRDRFPGCVIMKPDPDFMPGVPDLIILYGNTWAMLEVKATSKSPMRPNQAYFVDKFNEMSFAAFINPDNEEEVLDALQSAFRAAR